jgi:hypothetical protein
LEEEADEDEDESQNTKIKIFDEGAKLDHLDIHSIEEPNISLNSDLLLGDIEVLA